MERLQNILAKAGIASRRTSAKMIKEGRVTVDFQVVRQPGARFHPFDCDIRVDGCPICLSEEKVYIMLNKPKGYISTVSDPRMRKTVLDLVPDFNLRLFPVGRLDQDTEGLIILTNDGHATYILTHPKFGIFKTYFAKILKIPNESKLNMLRKGIKLPSGHISAPAIVRLIKSTRDSPIVEIKIREGRKRQIRHMFDSIGHPIENLKRVGFGELTLGDLESGQWRYLTHSERNWIQKVSKHSTNS